MTTKKTTTTTKSEQLLDELRIFDVQDTNCQSGRGFGYAYFAGEELRKLAEDAYQLYLHKNALDSRVFPSVSLLERAVVGRVAEWMEMPETGRATFTSGGTESIMLAVKVARDRARPKGRGNLVGPKTLHGAFRKACEYLGLEFRGVDLPDGVYTATAKDLAPYIDGNTVLLAASAPEYTHGQVDDITDIAKLAGERGIRFHVDACIGGVLLYGMRAGGMKVPDFDFRVPGVTSISVDLHKYAYCPNGASVVLLRDRADFDAQVFVCADWPGYPIVNTTIQSSRSAGPLAAAWAVLEYLGNEGIMELSIQVAETTAKLSALLQSIDGVTVLAPPATSLIAFSATGSRSIELFDALRAKGWMVHVQPGLEGSEVSLHLTVTPVHLSCYQDFAEDVRHCLGAEMRIEQASLQDFIGDMQAGRQTEKGMRDLYEFFMSLNSPARAAFLRGALVLLFVLLPLAGGLEPAHAGGPMVPGAGPSALGRAGAFTAKADDPTAMTHNPAGFSRQSGTRLYTGANFLRYSLSYQRGGTYEQGRNRELIYAGQQYPLVRNDSDAAIGPFGSQLLPSFVVASDLGHPEWPLRFAVGLFTPHAYPGRKFSSEVVLDNGMTAPAPQRYDSISQDIVMTTPSLAVAYQATSRLSFGARATWGIARLKGEKAVWTLQNYEEDPSLDSVFELKEATDRFVPSFGLGALYRVTSNIELGASYNSPAKIHAKGVGASSIGEGTAFGAEVQVLPRPAADVQCAHGGKPGALRACASLNLAQNATIGARYVFRNEEGEERADVELDLRWEDWTASDSSTVQVDGYIDVTGVQLDALGNPHGFRDVLSTRLGGSYRSNLFDLPLELRGGVAYDTKTAPNSWARVDQDTKERVTFGSGFSVQTGRFRFDLGGAFVWQPTVTVANNCKGPEGPYIESPGCGMGETPVEDRTRPSPGQPLFDERSQKESPFNAGVYKSHYFSVGLGMQIAL